MWNRLSGAGAPLSNAGAALLLALLLSNAALGAEARMSRHALIIGIGEYAARGIETLHGVKHDMESATRMAETMGIPTSNIRYLRDKDATLEGIRKEIRELERRINQGDRVFVYYSGHGTRYLDESISKDTCTEALMASDGNALTNRELGQLLKRIADKTDKLFVFYDACFSGGVATEPFQARSVMAGSRRFTPKVTPAKGADACYKPSNFITRGLTGDGSRAGFLPNDVVHVAASKPDQVSFDDGASGGIATTAWRDCLLGEARDLDRSGAITIAEITACAQSKIDDVLRPQPNIRGQNMVIGGNGAFVPAAFRNAPPPVAEVAVAPAQGNASMGVVQAPGANAVALPAVQPVVQPPAAPVAVAQPPAVPPQATAPAPPAVPAPTAPPAAPVAVAPPPAAPPQAVAPPPAAPVPPAPVAVSPPPATAVPTSPPAVPPQAVAPASPEAVLAEIHAQRDAKRQVMVTVPNTSLRIGRDKLEFRISADTDGHVYVALAGSDSKSLYLLYPNDLARNNFLEAGRTLTLPGASWQITAGGPPGNDTLLVLVTDSPRDLGALGGSKEGPFMSSLNDQSGHARIQWMMGNSANADASDCKPGGQNLTRNLQVVRKCSDAFGSALVTIQERN